MINDHYNDNYQRNDHLEAKRMRLNIEITEARNQIYKISAQKLGVTKTEMVTKAIDRYITEELRDRKSILEFELIRLEKEIDLKKALLKQNS